MKLEIIKKAWAVSADVDDVFYYDMPYINYGTRGKAKESALYNLDDAKLNGVSKHWTGINGWGTHDIDQVGFMDLKCIRAKDHDLVIFRGREQKRYRVLEILEIETNDARWDKMLISNPSALAYIWKGARGGYYGPNHCGYYSDKIGAGIYPIKEAVRVCKGTPICDDFKVELIDIDDRNRDIDNRIKALESKIDRLKSKIIHRG